ncbi:MAG: hypothetical protein ACK40E_04310 [Caldimicrobium sp.]
MQNQTIAKNPVLLQLPTGIYLGLVCYNPLYENLKFVLEKRDFFEMEWPALIISQEKGFFPILLGLPYITIQRQQILWYTTHIPAEILNQYQAFIPLLPQKEAIPPASAPPSSGGKELKPKEPKIIPFPQKGDHKKGKEKDVT